MSVPGELPFFYDLYTFRGAAGKTTIVAAYAVQAASLRREREDGCVQYRIVVSLVLADTAAKSVARTDHPVILRLARSPRRDYLVRTHLEVEAVPSASTLQRVIMSDATTPGFGQLYQGPFPIPDYSGSDLMLSDLAVGEPDGEGGWQRGEITLSLLPTGQLPQGSFDLFYEIYNLPAGHEYSTEIFIEPADDGVGRARGHPLGEGVLLRFTAESAADTDGTLPELRRVMSSFPAGGYRLTVTIRDEVTGNTAERSRPFHIGG